MLRLGAQAGKVAAVPAISTLQEDNVRKGFFEREQLDTVTKHLPEYPWPLTLVAYITG